MSAMIDTLQTAEDLKAAGMPETQAKAVARVMSLGLSDERLATKADLNQLEARLTLKLTAIVGGLLALFKMLDVFVG